LLGESRLNQPMLLPLDPGLPQSVSKNTYIQGYG